MFRVLLATLFLSVTLHSLTAQVLAPNGERLKILAAKTHMLIGGSTDLNHNDSKEEQICKNEFSIMSNENALKPYVTEPSRNSFSFRQADYLVGFGRDNGIVVKGHTLFGNESYLPGWMKDANLTATEQKGILINHVTTLVNRYRPGSSYGEVKYWDVVNEVSTRGHVFQKMGKNPDGDWLYIEEAFRAARAANPSATLSWNEDNHALDEAWDKALAEKISRYKARGVPIDAVGFQMHVGFDGLPIPDYDKMAAAMKRFTDMGLKVAVTELDVPGNPNQTKIYRDIVRACLNNPNCAFVATWNVIDKYSWRGGEMLLFNNGYEAKATYYGVQTELVAFGKSLAALTPKPRKPRFSAIHPQDAPLSGESIIVNCLGKNVWANDNVKSTHYRTSTFFVKNSLGAKSQAAPQIVAE